MSNRWESASRPVFVRTVFINGNRHAILSQEDPLCHQQQQQQQQVSRKQSRPSSSHSYTSQSSTNSSTTASVKKRFTDCDYDYRRNEAKITKDLQGCIVKLRLALETNERKKINKTIDKVVSKNVKKLRSDNYNKQRRKRQQETNVSCDYCETNEENTTASFFKVSVSVASDKIYQQNLISKEGYYFYNKKTTLVTNCYCENKTEEENDAVVGEEVRETVEQDKRDVKDERKVVGTYVGVYQPSILGENNDISWNSVSPESFFTKQVYNPLSERVLQWLDLASKKKLKMEAVDNDEIKEIVTERICEGSKYVKEVEDKRLTRSRSEGKIKMFSKTVSREEQDVDSPVKTDTDVDTVLSTVDETKNYPQYTEGLNKEENSSRISIRQTENFNKAEEKKELKKQKTKSKKKYNTVAEKRTMLVRQTKLEESSEEEEGESEKTKWTKMKRNSFVQRNNNIFHQKIDLDRNRSDLLKKYRSKYMPQEGLVDDYDVVGDDEVKQDIPAQRVSRVNKKIPWLRDYHHCRNSWSNEKSVSKPQLHIFMPAVEDSSNGDESECGSFLEEYECSPVGLL